MKRSHATLIALLFFIVFDSLVLYGTYLNKRAQYLPIQLTGEPAPEFAWQDFDGKTHQLKELAGHVVILHFWAEWCPPCREELPGLLKMASEDKNITVLAITSDDTLEKPKAFAKASADLFGIKPPANVLYAWDPSKVLTYEKFQTDRYPESIILDKNLHLRRKFPSPLDWKNAEVQNYLKGLKEEK